MDVAVLFIFMQFLVGPGPGDLLESIDPGQGLAVLGERTDPATLRALAKGGEAPPPALTEEQAAAAERQIQNLASSLARIRERAESTLVEGSSSPGPSTPLAMWNLI